MSILKVLMIFHKFEMTIRVYKLTIACMTFLVLRMSIRRLTKIFLYLTMTIRVMFLMEYKLFNIKSLHDSDVKFVSEIVYIVI